MSNYIQIGKKVKIVYYSGTGCSEKVARCFALILTEEGYDACSHRLMSGSTVEESECNLLIVIYAVYACNAPEPVYKWIDGLDKTDNIPAVVISVSGGGEVTPNTACRQKCINKLERKGYNVVYDKMLVMPSNFITPTKERLALMLLDILPSKVRSIVEDISNGIIRRSKPKIIDRIFSTMGKIEKYGAIEFGKRIKVANNCNGCGYCIKGCPSDNITLLNGKPKFSNKCHLCLSCIYGCPKNALSPGIGKFIVLKDGFSIKELEKKLPLREKGNIEELAKGYLWSGVRKYLKDSDK